MRSEKKDYFTVSPSATEQTVNSILHVGTSGYVYADWVEAGFYPAGAASSKMLGLYAQCFGVTELNYTWYRMPKASMIERQMAQAPDGFRFAAKLTRTMTHEIPANWRREAALYRLGLAPLVQARRLIAVLLQFPPHFARSVRNRQYLAALLDALEGLPLAVEFRDESWDNARVFEALARHNVALVAVDAPPLPGLFPARAVATRSDWFYARLHGRNVTGWRSGQLNQKFHYDYRDDELAAWLDGIIVPLAERAAQGYVFFNNHYGALAPKNALRFAELARARGLEVRA
ncbi:MAG: DUF72 domain-containing protein [Planctomycetes bacterium]|nr:DUF72 domain-containing protein [Planctomycetota bacterium]